MNVPCAHENFLFFFWVECSINVRVRWLMVLSSPSNSFTNFLSTSSITDRSLTIIVNLSSSPFRGHVCSFIIFCLRKNLLCIFLIE